MPFNRTRRPHLLLRGALAVLLATSASMAAAGQVTPPPRQVEAPREAPAPAPQTSASPLLDAPVSRTEYLLGPGDVVHMAVFGDTSFQHSGRVTPDGTFVIPGIGATRVLGVPVTAAEARVAEAVRRLYRNVTINLTLSEVRTFKVYLVGDIPSPGTRTASAVTRVSEVVPPRFASGVIHRNLLLRRASGDSLTVDLARFVLLGDLRANPTLREGDAVLVRAADETVSVVGKVISPGAYEYRRGETLAELLELANGGAGFPSNAADTIRVTRFVDQARQEILALTAAEAVGPRGRGIRLEPFDAVFVPELSNFRVQRVATITGQVARPGTYPIRPDTTTLTELVAIAGGLTPQASLFGATLRRRPAPMVRQPTGEVAPSDAMRSRTERQIAEIEARSDVNIVTVDFPALFTEGSRAYDVPLRTGDVVNVPERRNEVAVLGAVAQPGLVVYAPGRSATDYIRMAGWFSRRADWSDAVLIRAGTGARLNVSEVRRVDPGDQIVVPFRERRTILERVQTTQAVIGILSGAAVTIATFLALF